MSDTDHIMTFPKRKTPVGFVIQISCKQNEPQQKNNSFQPVQVGQRKQPGFAALKWGIFTGDPLKIDKGCPYNFPPKELFGTQKWQSDHAHTLSTLLHEVWTSHDKAKEILCPNITDVGIKENCVRRWREEIMPMSACIIQGLYCPDGQWERLSQLNRNTADWYDKQWAFAAATLVRGWLAFYARDDAPRDRQHKANHLLLWRIYALVLIGIVKNKAKENNTWSDDQTEELERAVGEWLRICQDAASAWLFLRQGEGWWGCGSEEHTGKRAGLSYREYRREVEVNRVVEALVLLRTLVPSTSSGTGSGTGSSGLTQVHRHALQAQLEQLVLNWYLPRYDVKKAEEVQHTLKSLRHQQSQALAQISTRFLHRGVFRVRFVGVGTLRLWAAIGTGYAATALQSDTWTLLYGLVHTHVWGFLIGLCAMAIMPYGYLVSGIHRKVHDIKKALYRALWVWGSGEMFALLVGIVLFWMFAPLIPIDGSNQSLQAMCDGATSFAMILLYAQIALFFGIFIQLIFDEKPTTAPLDVP